MKNLKITASLTSLLTVLFVTLKLTGVIDWSWIWVLAPIWVDVVLALLIGTFVIFFVKKFR